MHWSGLVTLDGLENLTGDIFSIASLPQGGSVPPFFGLSPQIPRVGMRVDLQVNRR